MSYQELTAETEEQHKSGLTEPKQPVLAKPGQVTATIRDEDFLHPDFQPRRKHYVSVETKFVIATVIAACWAGLSIYLAQPWLNDLAARVGYGFALTIILGIAIAPGFMNAFLVASLAMDRRPNDESLTHYPGISILIAAYNEEATIVETIDSIALQGYPGEFEVIVVDDGSSDRTGALVTAELLVRPWLKLVSIKENGGKARALNQGLARARHSIVVTVDADSCLYNGALRSLVGRYLNDPPNTRMVAGTVLVRNSRASWIAKAQEWDYFHGISAIKRVQSLFQGTMVAQGAFSLYDRRALVKAGGWPDCVGEDIVLTWAFLKAGYRVGHCEDAYLFTNVPTTLKQFSRQRQRWSRGMIEAFKQHPDILLTPRLSTLFVYWNLLFPAIDLIFTISFIPGLILALFGYFWIVGPMTLALIPAGLAINLLMFKIGKRTFRQKGLGIRHNIEGFLIYVLGYNLIMQPVCVAGYFKELVNTKKSWGTK